MVDTRIPLMGRQGDFTSIIPLYQQARLAQQQIQQGEQQIQQGPIRQQILQQQADQQQFEQQQARQDALTRSVVRGAALVKPYIDNDDYAGAMKALEQRRANLKMAGVNTDNTDQAIELLQTDQQQFKNSVDTLVNFGTQAGILKQDAQAPTAAQREYAQLTQGLSEEEQDKARRIKLGLEPRATGSAAITTATTEGLTEQVAASESTIKGQTTAASETAKLKTQFELKPEVEAAVTTAIARAKQNVALEEKDRSNARALTVYDTAITGLAEALGETVTGPLAGLAPALFANQQIADGAVAAMAPILKDLFRTAGEGTFTDQDQKLLLDMIPTRKDLPKAREAKLKNIDAIVRAKLAAQQPAAQQPAAQQQQTFTTQSGITFTVSD